MRMLHIPMRAAVKPFSKRANSPMLVEAQACLHRQDTGVGTYFAQDSTSVLDSSVLGKC